MENRKLQIPVGMQDTLPGECARQRLLEQELREMFRLSGYQEIATPILEYYDALDDATYGYRPEDLWKTFDARGRILALRPDTTIPAVRMAAGRLSGEKLPLRLCYIQSAATCKSDTLSLLCEEPQAGVELMGESGPLSDAEVIALAISTLDQAGLRDFQLELGQAMFFDGFMQEAGLTREQSAEMRELTSRKDSLSMQLYLDKLGVGQAAAERLMQLPRLYGDVDILDKAESLTNHPLCRQAISNLRKIYRALEKYGVADKISFDLGMVHHANYYSGMIFRGITASLGQPLLSGGRYDGLPERYGRSLPAVGFAVSIKLLMMALERQGEGFQAPVPDELVGFTDDALEAALVYVRERRGKGVSAAMVYSADEVSLRADVNARRAGAAAWITADGVRYITRGKEEV